MKIFYSRVSKEEEGRQDQEAHKTATLKKFNLKESDIIIYEERGSAYDVSKFSKRKEFIALLTVLFEADKTTILDIFLGNYKEKEIELYVWDWHRIMRNIEFCLFFGLLCDWFNIRVYSCKQGILTKEEIEIPAMKFSRYIMLSAHSFSGEEYSHTISTNIKKVVRQNHNITVSTKGNKWGKSFKDNKGNKVMLDIDIINNMNKYIIWWDTKLKKMGRYHYYDEIIQRVEKQYKVHISKPYISKLIKASSL